MGIQTVRPRSKPPEKHKWRLMREQGLINYDHLITEDDEPVDNVFSEVQQRLLTEPLYSNWKPKRDFLAFANVGLFHDLHKQAIVPDVMVSMDVERPEGDAMDKHTRSYFVWEYGKPPDIVIEIVSNRKGNELTSKVAIYERLGVPAYVILDPMHHLSDQLITAYKRVVNGTSQYMQTNELTFPLVGLSLKLWDGEYQEWDRTWLRWHTLDGELIPTGDESTQIANRRANAAKRRADTAERKADTAKREADTAKREADAAKERANVEKREKDALIAKLIAAGIDPNSL